MSKLGNKYFSLYKDIENNFLEINKLKFQLSILLCDIKYLHDTEYEISDGFGSFNSLLASLGKSYSQVKQLLNVGNYLKKYNINIEDIKNIPINYIELMFKLNIVIDDDIISDLETLSYSDIIKKYKK